MHVYDPRFAAVPGVRPPSNATVADYRRMQSRLGLGRAVVIQPSAYGTDNECTLDAAARLGGRAVVAIDPSQAAESISQLSRHTALRGIRCHMMIAGSPTTWESLPDVAARAASNELHIELQATGAEIANRREMLARLPCDLVIDHIGRLEPPMRPRHPELEALLRLLESGRCWVKLSAPYHNSAVGPPDYGDIAPFARALIRRFPERLVWASNWPHPSRATNPPDDRQLLELLLRWTDDAALTRKILVENPALLYRFAENA